MPKHFVHVFENTTGIAAIGKAIHSDDLPKHDRLALSLTLHDVAQDITTPARHLPRRSPALNAPVVHFRGRD